MTSCGGLSRVYITGHHDVDVCFFFRHFFGLFQPLFPGDDEKRKGVASITNKQMLVTSTSSVVHVVSREFYCKSKNHIWGVWHSVQINVRFWWQFHFREVQKVLQQPQHQASSITVVPPPKQWTSRSLHKIH